jgi:MSHA pilin protein MshA
MLRNEKGFTLIEIIAVLVILGILAAVAVPKYLSLMDQARQSAAQSAIAEMKARASNYYASYTLSASVAPTTGTPILSSVQANIDVGSDYVVTAGASGSDILITVTSEKGSALTPNASGTWYFPQ